MTNHQQTTALPLRPGRWAIDPAHSSVVFSVRHLGLSRVRGRFSHVDATMSVGRALEDVHVEATIDMASVDTNNHDRDTHLRSTDFFSTDAHPTMRFTSTDLVEADGSWILRGDLTINGVTRSLSIDVEFNGVQPVQGVQHAGFSATTELCRTDFGINFGLLPIGADRLVIADAVAIELEVQFVEPTTT